MTSNYQDTNDEITNQNNLLDAIKFSLQDLPSGRKESIIKHYFERSNATYLASAPDATDAPQPKRNGRHGQPITHIYVGKALEQIPKSDSGEYLLPDYARHFDGLTPPYDLADEMRKPYAEISKNLVEARTQRAWTDYAVKPNSSDTPSR